MSSGQQVTFFRIFQWAAFVLLALTLSQSCVTIPKDAPNKPFVYQTNVYINGKTPGHDKKMVQEQLLQQVDDSLKVRLISYAGVWKRLVKPTIFDTMNIGRSRVFMTSLLNSMGYFYPVIRDTFYIDTTNRKQQRVFVNFFVNTGIPHRIDSIGYDMTSPELQELAMNFKRRSQLKLNQPYSTSDISAELDRLLSLYRDNGYYKLTREDLYAERDTVVAALIDPTLDPFEQVRLLDSLRRKKDKPTISIVFKQRTIKDSSHLKKFYVGDVTVYPDLYILEDSTDIRRDTAKVNDYKFIYNSRRFKLPFIADRIYLQPGTLYRQRRYFRTINTFNQLGAWSNVDLSLHERYDSVPLLDATLRLYPSKKQSLSVDVETSRNVTDFLTTGTLFGIGLNLKLMNRNAYREAIQTSTNARFGIELGTNLVQTLQASLSHNIYFPKFILPFKLRNDERFINPRTVVNFEGGYTDRRDFFQVPSFKTSWGYEWTTVGDRSGADLSRKRFNWQYTPLNFEYTNVRKTDSLRRLEDSIPAYRFAFNDGMIISQIFSVSTGYQKDNRLTLIRARIEESGALFGLIKDLELGDLRRYVKLDAEFKHYINYKKSSWAFRAYGGIGIIYGKSRDSLGNIVKEYNLPFFKAFTAGGPYSMRAWQVRRLGPGSSTLYEADANGKAIDRFGNMQLEFNAEYRFNVTTIAGIKLNSALFVDAGNIWSNEFVDDVRVEEATFHLNRLYKDLAVGGGVSARLDFDFFLIRLDWAYKLKDPRYSYDKAGWFHKVDLGSGQFQLGIGYPF